MPSRRGPFGGPVAGGAGAVLLAGEDAERCAALGVADRGVVDGHRDVFGEQAGDAAFGAGGEFVAQADVGEGAADHDLVVAAAAAVAVEVGGLDAVVGEVLAGGAVHLDGAGGGDVVGGDGVAEDGEARVRRGCRRPARAWRSCRRSRGPCGCRWSRAPSRRCRRRGT